MEGRDKKLSQLKERKKRESLMRWTTMLCTVLCVEP